MICHSTQTLTTGLMLGLVTGFFIGVFATTLVHK
jgi:hypothetical protein